MSDQHIDKITRTLSIRQPIAVFDLDEIHLYEQEGDKLHEVEWPTSWPSYATRKFVKRQGFLVVDA